MDHQYSLIVIGAGPGGYVAAIKAAKLGIRTAIVEERKVGGTCLNRGCIPAKAMLHAAALYREMKEGEKFGIFASDVRFDYEKIVGYKEETTDKLVQGVEQLLRANGVEVLEGKGTLLPGKKVQVEAGEQKEVYCADTHRASGSAHQRQSVRTEGSTGKPCDHRRRGHRCGACHRVRKPWL